MIQILISIIIAVCVALNIPYLSITLVGIQVLSSIIIIALAIYLLIRKPVIPAHLISKRSPLLPVTTAIAFSGLLIGNFFPAAIIYLFAVFLHFVVITPTLTKP